MATAAVQLPTAPHELHTPSDYFRCPFELPEQRFVGLLACQRDPLLRSLHARVTRCEKAKPIKTSGKKSKTAIAPAEEWEVELDDTGAPHLCFPTGGGQPSDVATITSIARPELSANVREAQRVGLAAVHLTDGPLDVGETVEVAIDWDRRLDLMTQHLGQHLLSAVLEQELHLDTPSWSLQPFSELSYIEIPRAISPAEIARVQTLCNAHIRADLPVHVDVALEGTDPRPPKMPSDYQGGVIRTVTIGGLDSNSCCGSHPPRLSLLQSLYISPYTTSIRGTNARIYFAVGGRVLAQLGESEKQLRETTSVLSCGAPELSDRVKTLFEDHRAKYRRERRLRTRLAAMEAKEILAIWPEDGVVLKEEADDDAEYLAMIASALAEAGPHRTIALAAQAQTGVEAALLVCGGGEVDHGSALRGAFGGRLKGGGKGRFAGKLSGKWGAEELAILQGVVKSLQ